jgi:hypothetical protein
MRAPWSTGRESMDYDRCASNHRVGTVWDARRDSSAFGLGRRSSQPHGLRFRPALFFIFANLELDAIARRQDGIAPLSGMYENFRTVLLLDEAEAALMVKEYNLTEGDLCAFR